MCFCVVRVWDNVKLAWVVFTLNVTEMVDSVARNWKYILEALSVALGTLIGGLVGFLIGKMDAQINLIQRINLVSHIYQINNALIPLLIGDNQYYLTALIYETIVVLMLLFGVFILFWFTKLGNRPLLFNVLTVIVIAVWFIFSFATLSFATIPSKNAIDIPNLNVSQSERLEIDSLVVSLDAFRAFVVKYDFGLRLLLTVFLMYCSSYVSTCNMSNSSKKKRWTYLVSSIAIFSMAVVFLFVPFVENRTSFSGTLAIWEGVFSVMSSPFWSNPLLYGVPIFVIGFISIIQICLLLRVCVSTGRRHRVLV